MLTFTKLTLLICFLSMISRTEAQDSWTQKKNFTGQLRANATGFSIGEKGYLGTGFHNGTTRTYYNDFWEYDPSTNQWKQMADVNGGLRTGAVGLSIGNKGFMATGDTSGTDVEEYDPVKNTWVSKAKFGGAGRSFAVGFSIGSKAYLGLGVDLNGNFLSDFWEYDTLTNKWEQKASFPGGARINATGFSIGNKGYIGTGVGFNNITDYNDFWEYDPAADVWKQIANLGKIGRGGAISFTIGNLGYTGFGSTTTTGPRNDIWAYDTSANQWTLMTNCDTSYEVFAPVAFTIGNKAFISTGINSHGSYSLDLWQYSDHTSGIPDPIDPVNYSLYPNPNSGHFILHTSYPVEFYEILDMNGKEIYRNNGDGGNGTINIDLNLANGMYMIRVVSDQGSSVKKFIVND